MNTTDLMKLFHAVDTRSRVPVLRCFCFASGKAYTTDHRTFTVCKGDENITGCYEASSVISAIKAQKTTEITQEEDVLIIGNIRLDMAFPADDFPPIPVPDPSESHVINVSELRSIFSRLLPVCNPDDARAFMNGIYFNSCAVSCDGHRLHKMPLSMEIANSLIIPFQTAATLQRIMPKTGIVLFEIAEDEVTKNKRMKFSFDGIELYSRAVDAEYPKFERVIPEGGVDIAVNKKELADALGVINKLKVNKGRRENNDLISIKRKSDRELLIHYPNGSYSTDVHYSGDFPSTYSYDTDCDDEGNPKEHPYDICLNARYLAHFVETETENGTISITFPFYPLSPIKSVTQFETQVLMPIKG